MAVMAAMLLWRSLDSDTYDGLLNGIGALLAMYVLLRVL